MRKLLVLFMLLFAANLTFAQSDVTISDGPDGDSFSSTVTNDEDYSFTSGNAHIIIDCNDWGFFHDRPGKHKPYDNDSDYYTTICADDSRKGVTVSFQQFNLEKFDRISVWDEFRSGPVTPTTTPEILNVNIPRQDDGVDFLGTFTGPSSPGTLTSRRGCLTFRFVSDRSVAESGWYAKIGCANRPVADPCVVFNSRVDREVYCGDEIKDDNIRGTNFYSEFGDCTRPGWPSTGRELIYKFVNTKARDLKFTLTEDNGDQPKKLNMYILNDCRPDACVDAIIRPAENAMQAVNYVELENAPAGTYYIVVDGNTTYAHNWFKLKVDCDNSGEPLAGCQDAYYYDDFEAADEDVDRPRPDIDYRLGDYISIINPFWSRPTGLRNARIGNGPTDPSDWALEFNRSREGTQAASLDLGQKFRGVYKICWFMFIEDNHTAFFGLFGGDESDPWGTINKEFPLNSIYTGRWIDVQLYVDLDNNRFILALENQKTVFRGDYFLNLDRLMFYGLPNAHFYVDDICYSQISRLPSISGRSLVLGDTPMYNKELELQLEAGLAITDDNTTELATAESTTIALNADELTVMPNPTSGTTLIALDLEKEQNVNLQIFSPTGQLVRAYPLGQTQVIRQEVDLSEFSNGMYILRATADESVITKKIILQR